MTVQTNDDTISVRIPNGPGIGNEQREQFIETNYHNSQLAEIVQSYAVADLCLIGPRGSGKSMLVSEIARIANQTCEPMVLYQDMTARDFVQQRTTTATGDTVWRDSPLVNAAKKGHVAILDGIHRIHNSTISVLHRFVKSFTFPVNISLTRFSDKIGARS